MKTIPPPCPEPDTGPKYWRSLDQLADTTEFREFVEREFPAGASELKDPLARREFMKLMSASFLLAGFGLTGCRKPVENIVPFSKMPEGYVHGVAKFYATAMPTRRGAIPLLVKSNDGRPTKVEGNPQHPDSNGGTDVFAQSSVLDLYDPDRAMRFRQGTNGVPTGAAHDFMASTGARFRGNGGQGLAFLSERSTSPSRTRLQQLIAQTFPNARWHIFDAVEGDVVVQASQLAFGQKLQPQYNFSAAKGVIVSLDCDFLGTEHDRHRNIRGFSDNRRLKGASDSMNRLYAIEPLMTLTGAAADHRLRVTGDAVLKVAAQLAEAIAAQSGANLPADFTATLRRLTQDSPAKPGWITECAKDLIKNRGQSLVVAGQRQPIAVHVIAHAMNVALGNVGKTVVFQPLPATNEGTLGELASSLQAGAVDTLIVLGGNPVYTAPADLEWAKTQRRAKTVIRLGYYEDETGDPSVCDWHLPLAHYLESWGDVRTSDGTIVPVQPLIEPLFGGVTEIEVLGRLAGLPKTTPYEIVRETFAGLVSGDVEAAWRKFLHDGYLPGSAVQGVDVTFNVAAAAQHLAGVQPAKAPSLDALELVFHSDYRIEDGRYANNGWLQELPDPITKMTWENVVLMSEQTARALNLTIRDKEDNKLFVPLVKVQLAGREIEGPAWIQPGMADNVIGLSMGYGRTKAGRIGSSRGYNACALRTAAATHIAAGAKISATGKRHQLATTQNHGAMEGRPIVREANLEQYRKHPDFTKRMDMEHPPVTTPLYANPLDELKKHGLHQWGMSIDLNLCVGCSACMIACQSENNVPIAGKEMVTKNREMHWLRIDRYFSGTIADPQIVTQPMLCQHCEAAPCENVCPVNATVHDEEGLNLMVYNRCVGTRYCSNNCPYKIRRFNYFDYNKRPISKLYYGPFAKRPEDEIELVKLAKNPDVTVRMRGVMEKCTFCIQRIEGAKIAQKVKAGASDNVRVADGTFTTACAQACPAGAIVFGDISDPNSIVSQLKKLDRDYTVLEFLATKPRLTYLARVRNPNPAIPDDPFKDMPGSFKSYSEKNGDPFESHGHGGGHDAGAAHGAESKAGKGAH